MTEAKVILTHKYGLHARPSQLLASTALKYKSSVEILWQNEKLSAKSVLNLISLGIPKGSELHLFFDGEDEEVAKEAIIALIKRNFDFNE